MSSSWPSCSGPGGAGSAGRFAGGILLIYGVRSVTNIRVRSINYISTKYNINPYNTKYFSLGRVLSHPGAPRLTNIIASDGPQRPYNVRRGRGEGENLSYYEG